MRTDYDTTEVASALLKRAGSDLTVKNIEDCKDILGWIKAAAENERNSDSWRTFWDTLQGVSEQERLHPTISSVMDFTVIEDVGGGLHLFVFDSDHKAVWGHVNYGPAQNELSEAVQALRQGADPTKERWPENLGELTAQEVYDKYNSMIQNYIPGWNVIADQDGIYASRMGLAGIQEFCSSEKDVVFSQAYTYKGNAQKVKPKALKM